MRRHRIAVCLLLVGGCRKHEPAAQPAQPVPEQVAADAVKDQALRDLQNDIVLLKAQLAAVVPLVGRPASTAVHIHVTQVNTALYLCDRLAIAARELAEDARAQAALGEADALCAYQVPLVAGERRLAALAAAHGAEPVRTAPPDCGPIRDALARVGAKYKNDPKIGELVKRFKSECPRMRLSGPSRAERPVVTSAVDPGAQRDACRRRCDDAAFSCRASCQYCGSCTTDKTWEWCNATCNNCRQGCEQNEKFCQASCGG